MINTKIDRVHFKLPEIYEDYKKKFNIANESGMGVDDFDKLFVQAGKDYLSKKISMDDFSGICDHLFILDKKYDKEIHKHNSDLDSAIEAGMELSYYASKKDENIKLWYSRFLSTVTSYLSKK